MRIQMRLFAASLLWLTSCTHSMHALDTQKPIVTSQKLFRPALQQEGEYVGYFDATRKLAEVPEAASHVGYSRLFFWSGIVTAAAGTYLIVDSLANYDRKSQLPLSLGLYSGAFGLEYLSRMQLIRAAEKHNERVGRTTMRPFFAPLAGGAAGGLQLTF